MSHILIIGKKGQLARALKTYMDAVGQPYTCIGSDEVDLAVNPDAIIPHIQAKDIKAVINASAYTNVDAAETAYEEARTVNAVAPGIMAKACAEKSIPFIHISTDYVFNGKATKPYRPETEIDPLNAYGRSKAEGEKAVMLAGGRSAILRTSWVYAGFGSNFLVSVLRFNAQNMSVRIVDDQFGRPTYAGHLAEACFAMLGRMPKVPTIYHVTNSGDPISWADFTRAIYAGAYIERDIETMSSKDYPTPAKRPTYSVLDITDFENATGHKMPNWKEGLKLALKERN